MRTKNLCLWYEHCIYLALYIVALKSFCIQIRCLRSLAEGSNIDSASVIQEGHSPDTRTTASTGFPCRNERRHSARIQPAFTVLLFSRGFLDLQEPPE